MAHDYEGKPTAEELVSLRRVADTLPTVAYVLCFAELCERASYYGTANVIGNFINRKLPVGGNGGGAPPRGALFGQTRKSAQRNTKQFWPAY
jgi:dipeptide/tripeptide permease